VQAGEMLVKSGMLEPKTVTVLGQIGRSAAQSFEDAKSAPPNAKPLGIFALMSALKDPDVNRAISFALNVSKAYGQSLAK
jgi:uncharacterized protein YjgD (DUF1641 family)